MRWDQGHESPDVIDRRGQGVGFGGGGGSGLLALAPFLLRHPVGVVIFVLLAGGSAIFGMLNRDDKGAAGVATTTGADQERSFVAYVLDDAQKTWDEIFTARGKSYRRSKLVLFTQATSTACGFGQAATGPFYCPGDERIYIDLSFNQELERKLGAKGDFAQAYVIAHEVGHHVQKQLGAQSRLSGARRSAGEEGASVRFELQADCYAGIWAHSTQNRGLLEKGDLNEAMTAAAAIGDDRLQRRSKGVVTPESFTHGTSEQRARWFNVGLTKGDLGSCDTFTATDL